jgi:hypothetical protein
LASGLLLVLSATALAAEQRLLIAPHATDARLSVADAAHLVIYEVGADDAPLLVWLGGTGGKPESGPQLFYEAALQRGVGAGVIPPLFAGEDAVLFRC